MKRYGKRRHDDESAVRGWKAGNPASKARTRRPAKRAARRVGKAKASISAEEHERLISFDSITEARALARRLRKSLAASPRGRLTVRRSRFVELSGLSKAEAEAADAAAAEAGGEVLWHGSLRGAVAYHGEINAIKARPPLPQLGSWQALSLGDISRMAEPRPAAGPRKGK